MVGVKIRIVEDEVEIAEILKEVLESKGYSVEIYYSADLFFQNWDKSIKALYLIDWNLPGTPGIELVRQIREIDKISPIFIVSSYTRPKDILAGLKAGADDYITKPFNYEELSQRVQNAWNKFQVISLMDEGTGGLRLLPDAHSFIKDGQTISLTSREYIIFQYLFNKLTDPVSREELISLFEKEKMTSRNIDVHIFSLRKKIKKSNMIITTVWGVGYKLVA